MWEAREDPQRTHDLLAGWRDERFTYEDMTGHVGLSGEAAQSEVFVLRDSSVLDVRSEPILRPYAYVDLAALQVERFFAQQGVSNVDFTVRVAKGCEDSALPQGVLGITDYVLLPLMQNSLKALADRPEKKITLEVSRDEERGSWELRLHDTGRGLGDAGLLLRAQSGDGVERGLGLSLARDYLQIVFQGAAELQALPSQGGGACFVVRLIAPR